LLRRHIQQCTGDDVVIQIHGIQRAALAGQAEINQPRLAPQINQDIGGLEVAVRDAVGVHHRQSPRQLGDNFRRPAGRQRSAADDFAEVAPRDVVEHDVRPVFMKSQVVHPHQMRMVQLSHHATFGDERFLVGRGGRGMSQLDHQLLPQLRVHRAKHPSLAAPVERREDYVLADGRRKLRGCVLRCMNLRGGLTWC
jgi:hypothetical protein